MYDLHIHSNLSDGVLDIQEAIKNFSKELQIVSFCDHEYIFNPTNYIIENRKIRLISGIELSCNIHGIAIEILGYNFDTYNPEMVDLVNKIRDLRNNFLKDILKKEHMENIYDLPDNIFRKDIKKYFINKYGTYEKKWRKYNEEYEDICHSVLADTVIRTIKNAGGLPVLAHPMESFKGINDVKIEKIILDMDINIVEMVTPKHTINEIKFINDLLDRYGYNASIGSDTHGEYLGNMNRYNINISDEKFDWIRQM